MPLTLLRTQWVALSMLHRATIVPNGETDFWMDFPDTILKIDLIPKNLIHFQNLRQNRKRLS
jgi:hypothetical protein